MTITHALQQLSNSSKSLFFCYSLASNEMIFANPAFLEFFGLEETVECMELISMVHPEDRQHMIINLKACIKNKKVEDIECRIVRANAERTIRAAVYLIKDSDKEYLAGHADDISIYKENENILNEHNSKKNAILNILSHDLAGPIGTINNLIELINKELPASQNKNIEQYVKLIGKISRRSIQMIHNFLNQEFVESQGAALLKRRVELISKLSSATQEYMQMDPDLELQFSCSSNKDKVHLAIDEDKFLQVIQNLISNAMKFTPAGGTVKIYIEDRRDTVKISISDTGIGIPLKYHNTLFDKFTNARRKGLNGQDSHGLGMSIIKTIVEWHGGKIWFESAEYKGTTFYIELPK